jgi:hypothetical protein
MKRMIFRVSRGRASPSFFELSMSKSTGKDEVEKVTKKIPVTIFALVQTHQ